MDLISSTVTTAVNTVGAIVEETTDWVGTDLMGDAKAINAATPEEIEAPTPEERWWTPAAGWPIEKMSDRWSAPQELVELGASAEDARAVVGELRVEILQLVGLKKPAKQLGKVDPYVVLLFERFAARTNSAINDCDAQWGAQHPRAFKLPVVCPYSVLHLAVEDLDRFDTDAIARFALSLGSLQPGTVYDAWFPLQFGEMARKAKSRGAIRLRLSVAYPRARERVLSYARFMPPLASADTAFVVPFKSSRTRRDSVFAYRGPMHAAVLGNQFRVRVFRGHIDELKSYGSALSETLWAAAEPRTVLRSRCSQCPVRRSRRGTARAATGGKCSSGASGRRRSPCCCCGSSSASCRACCSPPCPCACSSSSS